MPDIFVVTNRHQLQGRSLSEIMPEIVAAGADAVILREKDLPPAKLYALATEIQAVCRGSRTKLIINSGVEITLACDAAGAHLGFDSLPPEAARRLLAHKVMGVSVHSTGEAAAAQKCGADYLLAGHVFATGSKPGQAGRGLDFIREVCAVVSIPVIAIGGISPDNARSVIEAGAGGIALMSGVMAAHDVGDAIKRFRQALAAD